MAHRQKSQQQLRTMNAPLISVIICTFNRAEMLKKALLSLQAQTLPAAEFEIIVVDNNSTDNTKVVVDEVAQTCPNLRYCKELKQGLSNARNAGLELAKGEFVAYTDDDCVIPKQWLETAVGVIKNVRPSVFGGPYRAMYNTKKPVWFKDDYGSRDFGATAKALPREYLSGNNIFFDRHLLELTGGFDRNLGMTGYRVAYGEEVAVQKSIRTRFPDRPIFYDPALYVSHLVRLEKMTLSWLIRAFFSKGRYVYLASFRNETTETSGVLIVRGIKAAIGFALDATFGSLVRNRKKYPYAWNYFYEHSSSFLRTLGRVYAQLQEKKEPHPNANLSAADGTSAPR